MPLLIERTLFIVAPQDSGKSTQLRSIFLDKRLETGGNIPLSSDRPNLPDTYTLGNERRLYLRLTSPHEFKESPDVFIGKTRNKMVSGRWSFACPLQPEKFNKMPDAVESVKIFIQAFEPERIRVVFLSPTRHGVEIKDFLPGRNITDELFSISNVEVVYIDARYREKNGLFWADFFDFT